MWKVSPFLLAAVALLHPEQAAASTYTVNPTRVYLNASAGSALVTLKNESAEPLRMQVKAQRWAQSLDGEIQLSATEDLIVFPGAADAQARRGAQDPRRDGGGVRGRREDVPPLRRRAAADDQREGRRARR